MLTRTSHPNSNLACFTGEGVTVRIRRREARPGLLMLESQAFAMTDDGDVVFDSQKFGPVCTQVQTHVVAEDTAMLEPGWRLMLEPPPEGTLLAETDAAPLYDMGGARHRKDEAGNFYEWRGGLLAHIAHTRVAELDEV